MQLPQNRRDVITAPRTSYKSSGGVLNELQATQQPFIYAVVHCDSLAYNTIVYGILSRLLTWNFKKTKKGHTFIHRIYTRVSVCGIAGIDESAYLCSSTKTYLINNHNATVPLHETMYSFAPAIMTAELMLTNVMMLSVLIAIFT